jgi:hypothetical protein
VFPKVSDTLISGIFIATPYIQHNSAMDDLAGRNPVMDYSYTIFKGMNIKLTHAVKVLKEEWRIRISITGCEHFCP